jgi:hypothetical protein
VNRRLQLALLLFVLGLAQKLSAQGTAFNYQGRLNDAGAPANASYDFRFGVYNSITNGSLVSPFLTNSAVAVTNGLFTVTLDFGAGVFTGGSNWLDLAVRAVGATNFTALTPRQPVLPVPYAIFSTSASNLLGSITTTQLSGTLPSAQLAGTYSGPVNFSNANNTFSGAFTGNGGSLSNLNATQLTAGTVSDARLSGNVALLNQNQTFTGSNNFNGPVTFAGTNNFYSPNNFTNRANNFTGNFFGNGLVGWLAVSSTSTNATRDTGYMLLSAGLTTVRLPTSASLSAGDIVRVSGAGGGGWLIQPNSGQSFFGNFFSYRNGNQVSLPTATMSANGDCYGIAASADGRRLYAVGNFAGIYASSDGGQTWAWTGQTLGKWNSIACSANGKIVYAAPNPSGTILFSTNSGANWSSTAISGATVCCSADGGFFTNNLACSGDGTYLAKISSGISISTNGGAGWSPISFPFGTPSCLAVASDCTRLVAGVSGGLLYATANQGATWSTLTTSNQLWAGAWMSADGSKFAAAASRNGGVNGGLFYTGIIPLPNTSATNSIAGSWGAAVELQYLGNNQFMPVSSAGNIWAN